MYTAPNLLALTEYKRAVIPVFSYCKFGLELLLILFFQDMTVTLFIFLSAISCVQWASVPSPHHVNISFGVTKKFNLTDYHCVGFSHPWVHLK